MEGIRPQTGHHTGSTVVEHILVRRSTGCRGAFPRRQTVVRLQLRTGLEGLVVLVGERDLTCILGLVAFGHPR